MEFLIVFFAFAISCVFILRLFASAYSIQKQSNELDEAVVCVQSAAERLKSCNGTVNDALTLFPHIESDGEKYIVRYDAAWKPTESRDSEYLLTLCFSESTDNISGRILRCELSVYAGDRIIYALPFVHHYAVQPDFSVDVVARDGEIF